MAYQRKDKYYQKAKKEGFRSRSAYKLQEMDKKFRLFKPGMVIVDLGCAPGGWVQVASRAIAPHGQVIGVDLEAVPPIPEKNAQFIQGDIREPWTRQRLLSALGRKVDLVLSDMAPHTSGIKFQDQFNSYELAVQALDMCHVILRETGKFIVKIFPGEELESYKNQLRPHFQQIKDYIPDATRKTSTEIYLVAQGYKTTKQ